jgi:hypothetical protein
MGPRMGFWLTYMDFGAWAVGIGIAKAGPAATAIAQQSAPSPAPSSLGGGSAGRLTAPMARFMVAGSTQ